MTWAVRAQRLFDGVDRAVRRDAAVVIEGARIVAVGPATQVQLPPGGQVVDVGDRTVMPGLIDAHVHMLSTGSAISGQESRAMTDHQVLLVGARNAQLALQGGLTTVRDCGDRHYLSLVLRDFIKEGGIAGPRLVCSGPVLTSTAGHLWWDGIECDTVDELRHGVRTLVKHGVDCIKLMGTGGNATPGSNPEASQYDAAGFMAVAEDAHRMGKRVAVHVHGVEGTRMAVDAGIDTLEHVPFRANGGIAYDDRLVDDIVRQGLIVSLAMPATWYRLRAEDMREARTHPGHLWEGRYETIRRMHTAGVKLVVSSDTGSTGTRIDELALLMEFLVEGVQIPAAAVLRGATGLAAEAVGMADDIGTLAPGKLADLIVVDGDPLTDISAMQRLHIVVKGGEVVVRDGGIVRSPADVSNY
ncbi:MAG TPA: amidohydrolase family protein [Candidatus Tectomicrobia bacterium]|nr:amidohydrolase family protein [Candidatus Tectomicrobia bacterium]